MWTLFLASFGLAAMVTRHRTAGWDLNFAAPIAFGSFTVQAPAKWDVTPSRPAGLSTLQIAETKVTKTMSLAKAQQFPLQLSIEPTD